MYVELEARDDLQIIRRSFLFLCWVVYSPFYVVFPQQLPTEEMSGKWLTTRTFRPVPMLSGICTGTRSFRDRALPKTFRSMFNTLGFRQILALAALRTLLSSITAVFDIEYVLTGTHAFPVGSSTQSAAS